MNVLRTYRRKENPLLFSITPAYVSILAGENGLMYSILCDQNPKFPYISKYIRGQHWMN